MKRNILNFLQVVTYKFKRMSFAKNILAIYLFIMLVGAIILWLPISQTGNLSWDPINAKAHAMNIGPTWHDGKIVEAAFEKGHMNFLDSLFTAASAFSDTGLSTNSAAVTYNEFGQAVLALLIFIGGLGWFALKVFIFNIIFLRPIGFRTRESLAAERGSVRIGVSRALIRVAISTLLIITLVASIVLAVYFYYMDPSTDVMNYNYNGHIASHLIQIKMNRSDLIFDNPTGSVFTSIKYGVFHTISALNNAGFDIIGNNSLTPYYYNVGLQVVFMVLFIIGGIGYPVIYDIIRYFKTKISGEKFAFSLFTKVSVIAYAAVAVIGLGVTFALEVNSSGTFWKDNTAQYGTTGNKTMALIFNTMSTRNAGFSTISIHDLSRGVLIQYIIMMFIGSAPSSTAGGIRTTTIAIIFLTLWGRLRGRSSVYAFKKRIPTQTVNNAFMVFFISMALLVIGTFIALTSFHQYGGDIWTAKELLYASNDPNMHVVPPHNPGQNWTVNGNIVNVYTYTELMFEVGSAFGTTGLSAGLTSSLSAYAKIYLIFIMFVGQLGVSSSILIWGKQNNTDKHFKWVKQDITIG